MMSGNPATLWQHCSELAAPPRRPTRFSAFHGLEGFSAIEELCLDVAKGPRWLARVVLRRVLHGRGPNPADASEAAYLPADKTAK